MLKNKLLKYLKLYLLYQTNNTSLLFFLLFAFRHLTSLSDYHIVLHILALFVAVFKQYNLLYILPTFIYTQNDTLSIFFLISSVLSCTQKWKLFLFLFTAADCYFSLGNSKPQFGGALSACMCILIYTNLIFEKNNDNRQYFIGFFMITVANAAYLFANTIQIWIRVASLVVVTCFAGKLSQGIIDNRFREIRSLQLENIKSPRIMARYIDMLLQDFEVSSLAEAKIVLHAKKCKIASCYCKREKESIQFYMRQMFENFMKRLGSLGDEHLWEYYIDFYLKKGQVLRAYYYQTKWKPKSYFSAISKLKSQAKIIDCLQKINYSNFYEKEYIYGLDYDQKFQYLSSQVHQILELKMHFWKEVAREYLSMHKMETLGCQIVSRMYELNKFYNYTIKQYEKYLFCFDSTIFYSMYLISTTNFKDYAKGIIKNTSKLMQEVYVSERNASQTFALRAVVKNSDKSFVKQTARNFPAEKDISTELKLQDVYQNGFKLVIDSVSKGLCKLINIPKQQLIGSQLNALVPNCYKDVHNVRLSQILDFNSDTISEITPSRVLHAQLKLLVKGANDELFSALICIKYHIDIKQGVTFVSVIKKTPSNKCQALATFDGMLMQKQKGFPSEVMKHCQVRKYLKQMKQEWFLNRTVKEQRFSLMIYRTNYEITISSPFAFLISDKQPLRDKIPPIHIQLLNQQNNKQKSGNSFQANNNAGIQIKKMQKMITGQQQSSATSSKGVNSAVNIISNFSETNSVPIYKYIIMTFLILLIMIISLNLAFNFIQLTSWDITSPYENPIIDHMNLYQVQISQWKAMLNLQDSINYNRYVNILNTSRISSYYTGLPFPTQISRIFRNITLQLVRGISSLWVNYSSLLYPYIPDRFDQTLLVTNAVNGMKYSDPPNPALMYRQIVLLFSIDSVMISRQMNYDHLLLPTMLNQIQSQLNSLSTVSTIISESLSAAYTKQLIVSIIFILIIVVLVVPMCLVLRKRFKTHERIFDLLSSIDSGQVTKQIQSLLYISNILSNYSESQQKLKLNVLDYQANAINPKHEKGRERKPSVMNELVLGLEKYDVVSNQANSQKNTFSQNILIKKLKSYRGQQDQVSDIFCSIRSEMFVELSKIAQLKGRKRSGQLDLSGSQLDEKKWIIGKHCALYVLLLSFIPFIIYSLMINFGSIKYTKEGGQIISEAYSDMLRINIRLCQAKAYLWEGKDAFKSKYNLTNELTLLTTLLGQNLWYSVYTNEQTKFIPPVISGIPKLSQYTTSLRLIDGKLSTLLKNLVQFRYKIQSSGYFSSKQSIQSNISIAQNLYEKIFYLQTLSNQRQRIVKAMANEIKETMFSFRVNAQDQKTITLTVLVIWSAISFGIGLILTFRMKKQFFQQVYILTFLNDQMLLKNKRVQSYLDNISKNTYF